MSTAPFLIRWLDVYGTKAQPKPVTAQAHEQAWKHAGDWIDLTFSDGKSLTIDQNDGKGLFAALPTSRRAEKCKVTAARRKGPHTAPVSWQIVSGKDIDFPPGEEHKLRIATRVRLSINGFDASWIDQSKSTGECDPGLMALLSAAPIDDVSLVDTIDFDQARPGEVKWSQGFLPLGSSKLRVPYLQDLIKKCHAANIQVGVGYAIVDRNKDVGALGKAFAAWLSDPQLKDAAAQAEALKKKRAEIAKHGQKILEFFQKNAIDIDGLTFDFECNSLRMEHKDNMALFIQSTARAFAPYNKWVAYDNAPFLGQDGGDTTNTSSMRIQPYALCAHTPNLMARPMCYNGKPTPYDDLKSSVAVALAPPSSKGGGIHPSQLQMAIRHWGATSSLTADEILRRAKEILAPNRVGLVLYPFPFDSRDSRETRIKAMKAFLDKLLKIDAELNPGLPRGPGQPLQVPKFAPRDPGDSKSEPIPD
jgi:hypothetical protein